MTYDVRQVLMTCFEGVSIDRYVASLDKEIDRLHTETGLEFELAILGARRHVLSRELKEQFRDDRCPRPTDEQYARLTGRLKEYIEVISSKFDEHIEVDSYTMSQFDSSSRKAVCPYDAKDILTLEDIAILRTLTIWSVEFGADIKNAARYENKLRQLSLLSQATQILDVMNQEGRIYVPHG